MGVFSTMIKIIKTYNESLDYLNFDDKFVFWDEDKTEREIDERYMEICVRHKTIIFAEIERPDGRVRIR